MSTYATYHDKATARQAIQFARMIELAGEGHRFFDLQRWNSGGTMAATLNAFIAIEKTRPSIFAVNQAATFTAGKNEIVPIPQNQIDIENSTGKVYLKQNHGY